MHARRRALRFASATAAALMSGGVAWAAAGIPVATVARVHASADSTTSSTDTTTTTTVAETTTTVAETTTTVAETTTTVAETTTTLPAETPPTSPQGCKPGWGYGDTNHCHSGPPGLNKKHGHKKP
jgi:hypothetical protein